MQRDSNIAHFAMNATSLPGFSSTEPLSAHAAVPLVDSQQPSRCSVERPPSVEVWGTRFARLNMEQTVTLAQQVIETRRPEYFITANVNYLMLLQEHPRLADVTARSLAVLADGHPIVLRSRLLPTALPCRVAGSDLIIELARLSAQCGYRPYLLGAAQGVAKAAADELCNRFPGLQIAGCYSPPFRTLTAAEHSGMLADIRAAKPDLLLVAFGQPKGEFWIYDHLHELNVPLSIQLGASFDFLAGTARRAPRIWQAAGCEWLYRAASDPRRLIPRYARNLTFLARKAGGDVIQLACARCSTAVPSRAVEVESQVHTARNNSTFVTASDPSQESST